MAVIPAGMTAIIVLIVQADDGSRQPISSGHTIVCGHAVRTLSRKGKGRQQADGLSPCMVGRFALDKLLAVVHHRRCLLVAAWPSSLHRSGDPTPTIPNDIEIRLTNVHLHGISGGKVVWEMVADDFSMSKTRPLLHIRGLKQVAVVNAGKQEITVSADIVEKNTISGDITLSGNVCVAGDKLLMHTPMVVWEALKRDLALSPAAHRADRRFHRVSLRLYYLRYSTKSAAQCCPHVPDHQRQCPQCRGSGYRRRPEVVRIA